MKMILSEFSLDRLRFRRVLSIETEGKSKLLGYPVQYTEVSRSINRTGSN